MTSWIIEGRYDFSIPEAQWLSDLAGIDSDLEAVIRLCRRYMAEAKKLSEISETGHGVWWEDVQSCGDIFFAAVVRYGRTLNSGSRGGIPIDWIEALPKEMQEAHRYHKTLRDKFVAHSVNCLEDNQVFVMLSPQFSAEQKPSHITVDKGRLLTPNIKDVDSLSALAMQLKTRVGIEIDSETSRLLQLAHGLPLDQIKQRGTESVPLPNKPDTYRTRQKFK